MSLTSVSWCRGRFPWSCSFMQTIELPHLQFIDKVVYVIVGQVEQVSDFCSRRLFRAVYTGTRPGLTPAIRAGKGWRGRRELAPRCSATQLAACRHDPDRHGVFSMTRTTHTTHNTQHTTHTQHTHNTHNTPHTTDMTHDT